MATNSTNLIIVESPSKARTLKRFLGDNYQIEASVGHIRNLDPKNLAIVEVVPPGLAWVGLPKDFLELV